MENVQINVPKQRSLPVDRGRVNGSCTTYIHVQIDTEGKRLKKRRGGGVEEREHTNTYRCINIHGWKVS